uniref:Interleukin-12 subunit alpha n=1 Tax=Knipowitschia caucasica TaxID=637954 RepID=A0AAV2J3Z2_KNICA
MCHIQRLGSFNESDCLKNIVKDLYHYEAIIRSYTSLDLRHPDEEVPPLTQTLSIIPNLLQACRFTSMSKSSDKVVAHMWEDSSYSNRLKMLMMMKAFYVRTITFNRAVGYIESGEHRSLGPSSDPLQ